MRTTAGELYSKSPRACDQKMPINAAFLSLAGEKVREKRTFDCKREAAP
jgi:hypothetical protein